MSSSSRRALQARGLGAHMKCMSTRAYKIFAHRFFPGCAVGPSRWACRGRREGRSLRCGMKIPKQDPSGFLPCPVCPVELQERSGGIALLKCHPCPMSIRSSESTKGFLHEAQLESDPVGTVSRSISEASLHEEDLLCPCPSQQGGIPRPV